MSANAGVKVETMATNTATVPANHRGELRAAGDVGDAGDVWLGIIRQVNVA